MSLTSVDLVKGIHKQILESHSDALCTAVDRVLNTVISEIRLIGNEIAILSWHNLEDSESSGEHFQKFFLKKHLLKAASNGDIDEQDFFKISEAFIEIGQWMQSFEFEGGKE